VAIKLACYGNPTYISPKTHVASVPITVLHLWSVKLETNGTGICKILQQVCGEGTLNRTQVFVWFKFFKMEREDTAEDIYYYPTTSRTDPNVEVTEIVSNDHWLSVQKIDEELNRNIKSETYADQKS